MLMCDCALYQLSRFINSFEAKSILNPAVYPHSLVLSRTNFQSWKCAVSPILKTVITMESFLSMPYDHFLCASDSLTCPAGCRCYNRAGTESIVVDCNHDGYPFKEKFSKLPASVPIPPSSGELIVDLTHNLIVAFESCNVNGYNWLRHVTRLNLEHNELTPKNPDHTSNFLSCLRNITHLYLAYNNINHLPLSIQHKKFAYLTLSGNKLTCDCNTRWLKPWLQSNNRSIAKSLTVHCNDKRKYKAV